NWYRIIKFSSFVLIVKYLTIRILYNLVAKFVKIAIHYSNKIYLLQPTIKTYKNMPINFTAKYFYYSHSTAYKQFGLARIVMQYTGSAISKSI
ncbi:MAG: hypothetical protein K2I71_01650, partial [Helicobacter sp.]|nr:hypothetical protein [Helicobacter sp.]